MNFERAWNSRILALLILSTAASLALAQRGRIEQGQITSTALTNNLYGDAATRPYKVYLPPSYDTTQKRYPVIYVLHGYNSDENSRIPTMQPALDSMIRQRAIGEMIAVFVNATNRLGGSWYLSSAVIGDYETYIVTDLVNRIDTRYRTLAARESRGITGLSMRGWGTMHLALKFPFLFSVAVAESGIFASRGSYVDGLSKQLASFTATNLTQFDQLPFPAVAFQALWAGLLPNPQRPKLYMDTPYEMVNGQPALVASANQRCLDGDVAHGDVSRYAQQAIRLNGIKIVHGTSDTTVPITEARQFTNTLATAGIDFTYEEHSGCHEYRPALALPFLSTYLRGTELYIIPPRLSFDPGTNGFQVTFLTQTNVEYVVESRAALDSSTAAWTEQNRITGNGQNASAMVSAETVSRFYRVRAANTPP